MASSIRSSALILVYTVANLPIVVWLMYDFFRGLPIELEELAQLDGATRFGIFWDIVLPLTRPGLAATALLTLILNWNEYLFAVFLSTAKAQTMPILVAAMNAGDSGILWWTMCVVIVVMIIPVIVMAIFLQRFIAKGVLLGRGQRIGGESNGQRQSRRSCLLRQGSEILRRGAGSRGTEPRRRARRVSGAARRFGVGQDHGLAHPVGAGNRHRRPGARSATGT